MLTMMDKNEILIRYFRNGENKSEISRNLGISRKTVRRYIKEHEHLKSTSDLASYLEKGLSSKPKYKTGTRSKVKLTIDIQEQINSYLNKNKQNRSQGLYKQLMKKADIHEALQNDGYDISYSTVCNYVRNKENKSKEAFIKQVYKAGEVCEFDWGEVKLFIEGERKVFNLAVFTCNYSNYRFAKLFHRQDTLAFSQSHIDFFSHLKGVPKEMVYDNMRVAVKRFVGSNKKEATQGLLELSNYYHFGFRFCNARKGNEKGHVERSVEYIRRKSFSSTVDFSSIEQANEHLSNRCETLNKRPQTLINGNTAARLIEDERNFLYRIDQPYKCFLQEYAKVDKYATISFQCNRYSVPDHLVGKLMELKVFAENIIIFHYDTMICKHSRSYGAHTWTLDLSHYLNTLLMKPGALANSLALQQADDYLNTIYRSYFKSESKSFLELIDFCVSKTFSLDELRNAVERVEQMTPHDISKDKIITILEYKDPAEQRENDPNDQITVYSGELLNELSQLLSIN